MSRGIKIKNKKVGQHCEPFIIAEAGINHNGDIELAKKMVIAAKEAGADAVKFQTFHADEFIQDESTTYTYKSQGKEVTESMLSMFRRCEFNEEEWKEIKRFCDKQEMIFLSTPQNISDLKILLKQKISAIKVGSDDFVNIPLIKRYAEENLPLLLSCGMANGKEIEQSMNAAGVYDGRPIVLFLCTSEYPTPPEDVNIAKLKTMSERYPQIVLGFSDHTCGNEAAIMAVAMGARVFEKHFTLSHELPGPDHWFSEEPQSLAEWVKSIRKSYCMVGNSVLEPTEKEMEMRKLCHRSITTTSKISAGEIFTESNVAMRRPGTGIPASEWDTVIGKRAVRDIACGEQIRWGDMNE